MRFRDEEGQAVVIVALGMSIFLIGAIGLGIDGAHLFAQRQMAQSAADASAIAGITSIFNGTYSSGPASFSTSAAFTCSTTDARTPCKSASINGFGGTADDTVTIDFPTSVPGIGSGSLSPDYPVNLVRATVSRNVSTTLMRLLGSTATTVTATATAAVVYVIAPVPILVMHPTLSNSLAMNGTPNVKICGGPPRSIQVNSNSATANGAVGNSTIDLSKAGPADTNGTCTTGTGADFGSVGGPYTTPPFTFLSGTTGTYTPRDFLMRDPLENVAPPSVPTNTGNMGTSQPLADGVSGCPSPNTGKPCQLYYPGLYPSGINGDNSTPVFLPGIYYIQSTQGFTCRNNCNVYMASGAAADTLTGTGWTNNVLFYNTGPTSAPTNAGRFDLSANGTVQLIGSPPSSSYKGILFFQDRNSDAHIDTNSQAHKLGGGGAMTLQGTIYLTNPLSTMYADSTHYQALKLQGGPGSGTQIQGEIIVGVLDLGGNGGITMNLNSNSILYVSEIALVN
jgi:hypothetical protein